MPEEITLQNFAATVQEMRTAQTQFFSNRSKQTLRLAKVLESKVDYLCKQIAAPTFGYKPPEQKELFT